MIYHFLAKGRQEKKSADCVLNPAFFARRIESHRDALKIYIHVLQDIQSEIVKDQALKLVAQQLHPHRTKPKKKHKHLLVLLNRHHWRQQQCLGTLLIQRNFHL